MLFSKSLMPVAVGHIIEATRTDEGVKRPYEYKERYKNEDDISKWVEKDWAEKKLHDAKKDMKKVDNKKYKQLLLIADDLMFDLSPAQKNLFKYKLLNDISR